MSEATDAYDRLLAAQRKNALLPPIDRIEADRARKVREQTTAIRRGTRTKAPA